MNHVLTSLALAALSPLAIAQCTLQEFGTLDTAPPIDNFTTAPVPIGFAFPFNGTTYTDMWISDHGIIALSNGTTPTPIGGASTYTPGAANLDTLGADCIFAYWGDHSTQGFGAPTSPNAGIWVDNTDPASCTVSWIDNEPYLSYAAGAFSVSVTLFPSGEIRIRLDDRCNNTSSTFGALETIVGVHTLNNVAAGPSDLSTVVTTTNATVFEEFIGPGPVGSNTPDPNFDLNNTTLTLTPLSPGWLCVPTPLDCGSTTDVGTGCGLTLVTTRPPFVGTNWSMEVSGVTAPAPLPVFIAYGMPVPPTPVGVLFPTLFGPTCEAHMDAAFGMYAIGAPTGGMASTSVAMPNNAALTGAALSAQAVAFDPGAPLLVLSNGNDTTIGY
jgi:hypothetical protein